MSRWSPAIGVFFILLGSYAYFWHSRDWNTATRLMLTYSLVDRGQVAIDGLEDHTRDRARLNGHFYTDKMPGYSFLAVPSYAISRYILGVPAHPLNRLGPEFPYWVGDYWTTLGTSGLMSALLGAVLTAMSMQLGASRLASALIGLAYGLATPAYVYSTLSYGHQATACLQFASFALLANPGRSRKGVFVAGLCASMGAVVELQAGPVSAIIGFYLLSLVIAKKARAVDLVVFASGALGPVVALLVYNVSAFGSPFDMGYFHEDLDQFKKVHAPDNPLGLRRLNFERIPALLWSEFRGLLIYAPVLWLTPLGWIHLAWRRRWGILIVTVSVCAAVLAVNLSYPEWTGGWSTGPRFLLPLIPFAMVPIASLLTIRHRGLLIAVAILGLAGAAEMLAFQAVGGRIPDSQEGAYLHPFRKVVLPIVAGEPLPPWKEGQRFERTIADPVLARWTNTLPVSWRFLQFAPLLLIQWVSIATLLAWCIRRDRSEQKEPPSVEVP